MRGDFSRIRFTPQKNYTAVLQQQGRVALDADANEQTAIDAYLRDTTNVDLIGEYGAPANDAGFAIKIENGKIRIGRGRYYVNGILVENDRDRDYCDQQFLIPTTNPPDPSSESSLIQALENAQSVQFVLQVWRRFVTELDDPCLVEPAIGQADTTARLQTVWRVLGTIVDSTTARAGTENSAAGCCSCCDGLQLEEPPRHTGRMKAKATPPSDDCGCQPIPAAGYQGLENQLYRVEIHTGGDYSTATFKWSRENASVVARVTQLNGSAAQEPGTCIVTANTLGPDANLGFQVNQWVELSDDSYLFGDTPNQPGELYRIQATGPGPLQVTLSGTPNVNTSMNARMRRWDQPMTTPSSGIPVSSGPVTLEYGIEVTFSHHGNFVTGDYWTIPARTSNGQIDWACGSKNDPFLPPQYFSIYQAPLASVRPDNSTSKPVVTDCRVSFSPLGEVDLAFHNKHLHGWGIVCGLQVNCGSDRTKVTVKKGYAIDCEGQDVRVCCNVPLNLVSMAKSKSLLNSDGNGTVSLVLNSDGTFAIEKQDKAQESLASYFQNTFWLDFFKKCIQPLISFVTSQFSGGQGTTSQPVSPAQERLDTFINMLDQLIQPVTGRYLFVSPEEDKILREFYAGFKKVLTSRTFCGLFDNARAFPDYPFASLNVHSIFGIGEHTRIRVNPNGDYAYTVGADNFIHVYDLNKMAMIAKVAFPTPSAVPRDVAITPDGKQLYAVGTVGPNAAIGVATIQQGGTLAWINSPGNNQNGVQILTNVQLVTLAVSGKTIYAVGTGNGPGAGLYEIPPGQPVPATPTYTYGSPAGTASGGPSLFGHLVVDSVGGYAYMTANDPNFNQGPTDTFNCVLSQDLNNPKMSGEYQLQYNDPSNNYQATPFWGTTRDDIAVAVDLTAGVTNIYVSVDPTGAYATKQLLVFNSQGYDQENQTANGAITIVDLGESDTAIRLAFNSANSYLLIAYASYNWVYVLDPSTNLLYSQDSSNEFDFPTELYPLSIAVGPSSGNNDTQTVYILNTVNRTITAAPAGMLEPSPATSVSLTELATYRNGVLDAFADLLGLILQDLKDCFCDRFLVNCPSCNGDEKLYLGDIQISDSQVYRICNLDRRRYVKSFPTYGYWLSIIPILPIMKWLLSELCCEVLPDIFRKYQAGQTVRSKDFVTSDETLNATSFLKGIDFSSIKDTQFARLATTGKLATDSIRAAVFNSQPAQAAVQIHQSDVVGQQAEVVNQRLGAAKIVVDSVQPYDPTAAAANITTFLGAPTTLPSGSHVILYEQNGVVRYYALAVKPTPAVQNLTTQVQAQQATLSSLEASQQATSSSLQQDQQLVASQQQIIAAHEQEIAALKTSLSEIQQAQAARDRDLAALQSQVHNLVKEPPKY